MSNDDKTEFPSESPEDAEIRRRLTAGLPEPSTAHDSSILKAAQEFTSEPPGERRSTVETLQIPTPIQADRTPRWAMAAAILATAGIGAMVLLSSPAQDEITRGEQDDVVPANGAELTDLPQGFTLPAATKNLGCTITLRSNTGTSVWTSHVFSTGQVALPASVQAKTAIGDYSWQANCQGVGRQTFGPYRFNVSR